MGVWQIKPAQATSVLTEDFESGLSGWTEYNGGGDFNQTTTSHCDLLGANGSVPASSSSYAFIDKALGSTYSLIYVRAYVNFRNLINAGAISFGAGFRSATGSLTYPVYKRDSGGNEWWGVRYHIGGGYTDSWNTTATEINVETWYCVELMANCSETQMIESSVWVNNVKVVTATGTGDRGLPTKAMIVCEQYQPSGITINATAVAVYYDCLVASETPIGLEGEEPSTYSVSVSLVSPSNETFGGGSFSVNFTVSTNGTLQNRWWNVENGSVWVYGSNVSYSGATSASGFVNGTSYRFYAWANLTEGASNVSSVMFSVSIVAGSYTVTVYNVGVGSTDNVGVNNPLTDYDFSVQVTSGTLLHWYLDTVEVGSGSFYTIVANTMGAGTSHNLTASFLYDDVDSFIAAAINAVNSTLIYSHVQYLTQNFTTRHYPHGGTFAGSQNQAVCQYLAAEMDAIPNIAVYSDWGIYHDVIGVLNGTGNATKFYVIGAHLDDVEGTEGATDDACGVAAVLEIARVLSNYEFNATIMFALWNYEEGAHAGSLDFLANFTVLSPSNIGLYINCDPIGLNGEALPSFLSNNYYCYIGYDSEASAEAANVVSMAAVYGLTFNFTTSVQGGGVHDCSSDHIGFWAADIPALNVHQWSSQGVSRADQYCNTADDVLAVVNASYLLNMTKLDLMTMALYAQPFGEREADTYYVSVSLISPTNTTFVVGSFSVSFSVSTNGTLQNRWWNVKNGTSWIYGSNQTYTGATSASGFVNGTSYTFYAWANNTDGDWDEASVMFTVQIETFASITTQWGGYWGRWWGYP